MQQQQQQQMIKTAMGGSSGGSGGGGGILVIGASGKIGSQVIKELFYAQQQQQASTNSSSSRTASASAPNTSNNKPSVTSVTSGRPVYGMCRDVTKVDVVTQKCCKSIYQGDARQSNDIQSILYQSRANLLIVCVGGGDSTTNNNVRKQSAESIVEALSDNPSFQYVQVIVVSREQQQSQSLLRSMMASTDFKLRTILRDHAAQEHVFRRGLSTPTNQHQHQQKRSSLSTLSHIISSNIDYDNRVWSRTLIVRPCMKFEKSSTSSTPTNTTTTSSYHPTICGGTNFSHYVNLSFNEMLPCVATTTKYDFCKWLVTIIICNDNLSKASGTKKSRSDHGGRGSTKHATTSSSGRTSPTTSAMSSSLHTTTHATRPYYLPRSGGIGGSARVSDCGTASSGNINSNNLNKDSTTTTKRRKIVVPPLAPSTHTFTYKHK